MTPPLLASAIFAAPVAFPGLSPLAVWIGLTCLAVGAGLLWRADDFGHCEGAIRADEARDVLAKMQQRRVT